MKKTLLVLSAILAAGAAHAGSPVGTPSVPEIDALSGLAALAAVGGGLTLLWERRRRK